MDAPFKPYLSIYPEKIVKAIWNLRLCWLTLDKKIEILKILMVVKSRVVENKDVVSKIVGCSMKNNN